MHLAIQNNNTTSFTNETVEELKRTCLMLHDENRSAEGYSELIGSDIHLSSESQVLKSVFSNITPSNLEMVYKDLAEYDVSYHWETRLASSPQYTLLDKAIHHAPWGSDQHIWTMNKFLQKTAEEIEVGCFKQAHWLLGFYFYETLHEENQALFYKNKMEYHFPKELIILLDNWELSNLGDDSNDDVHYDLHYDFENCDENFILALPHLRKLEDYFGQTNDPDKTKSFYYARLTAEMIENDFFSANEREEFDIVTTDPVHQKALYENHSKFDYSA